MKDQFGCELLNAMFFLMISVHFAGVGRGKEREGEI